MSLPATHKALVVLEPGKFITKEQALPKYGDDELLVKVKAVALNPTDWKVRLSLVLGSSNQTSGSTSTISSNLASRSDATLPVMSLLWVAMRRARDSLSVMLSLDLSAEGSLSATMEHSKASKLTESAHYLISV